MRLILVRHGETEENKKGILQGRTPGILSSQGKEQAKKVAQRLKWLPIDIIYTSGLDRCFYTAEEIAKFHNCKLEVEPLIIEKDEGNLAGKVHHEIDWRKESGDKFTGKNHGGESLMEVMERTKNFYAYLLKKHSNHTVVVVTHGSPIRTLVGVVMNETVQQAFLRKNCGNTAITEIKVDAKGNSTLICYDDQKHLQ